MLHSGAMRFRLLGLLALTTACSQSALRLRAADGYQPLAIVVPQPLSKLADDLQDYLVARRRFEAKRLLVESGGLRFVQPWVRDTSLRYYMLQWDKRIRHVADWKAEWTLTPIDAYRTKLEMRVLEVLFISPPWSFRPRPEVSRGQIALSQDWFETEADSVRAAFEARRFLTTAYPLQRLPTALGGLKAPELAEEPMAKEALKPRWRPLERRRTF